jgi:hypothetical protein
MVHTAKPLAASNNRLQILLRDRLDDVPIFIEHLNVAPAVAHALLGVIERVLAAILSAVNGANAFSFETSQLPFFHRGLREGRTWIIRVFIISSLIPVLTISCRAGNRQDARSDPQRFVEPLALVSTIEKRFESISIWRPE